jgi:putative nucleotidyltransferase with HDIG domain
MSVPIDAKRQNRTASEFSPIRVSEVVSALSYSLDLSEGQARGHSVRTCVLGMRLAQEIGLPQAAQGDLYYALLMKDAGCSSKASPLFGILGADGIKAQHGWNSLQYVLSHLRTGLRVQGRVRKTDLDRELVRIRCDRGAAIARRMGLQEAAASAIRSCDEHWNGKGGPDGLRGEKIPLLARIVNIAQTLDASHTASGAAAALDTVRKRSGRWFDPDLVRAANALAARDALWSGIEDAAMRVCEMAPREKPLYADEATLDNICWAFADLIDAKTPFTHRHSTGVAGTAVFLARTLGLSESEVTLIRRAALLHDIGKLGVPNSILEKPGKLTGEDWAALRKHAYYSYSILKRVPGFGELSEIAGSHHEKLDGSGYFRGLRAEQLSAPVRILVIADIYDALSSKRPYRDALPPEQVFQIMKKEAPHALDATCLEVLLRSFDPASSNTAGMAQLSAHLQHDQPAATL